MTYYGPKELAASFRTVRGNTVTIAREIGEQHYGFSPAPGTRTVAETLVHIVAVTKLPELIHGANRVSTLAGLNFPAMVGEMMAEEKKIRSKPRSLTCWKPAAISLPAFWKV